MKQIESYKGFETIFLAIKMKARMLYITMITCLFFHAFTFFLIFFLWLDTFDLHIIFTLIKGWLFSVYSPERNVVFNLYDKTYYLKSPAVHQYIVYSVIPNVPLKSKFIVSIFSSFLSYIIVPILFYAFWKKSKLHATKEHIRGPKLITPEAFLNQTKKYPCYLPFGQEIQLPVKHEAKHLLLTGSPGSGKTVLLSRIVDAVIKRKNNYVIYDFKGDFLSKFFNKETDCLFNSTLLH